MPHFDKFIHGFGLTYGLTLGDYRLTSVEGSEQSVKRYREYKYPITLTFTKITSKPGNTLNLLTDLRAQISKSRVIYTSYGNPYQCTIENPHIESLSGNKVVITMLGHAHRI